MGRSGSKHRTSVVEMSVMKVHPYLRPEVPLLWLGEKGVPAPRLLPIAIGEFEAAAIQMELDEEHPLRPISYDLFASMVGELEVCVRRVFIHSHDEQIFHAVVVVEQDGHLHEIDCRPSDGIAMALRTRTPIFVAGQVLSEAGIPTSPDEGSDAEATMAAFWELEPQIVPLGDLLPEEAADETQPVDDSPAPEEIPAAPVSRIDQLRGQLERAVLCEAYEEAALLRDEIALLDHRTDG